MVGLNQYSGFDSWNRPAPEARAFYSQNLERHLEGVASKIPSPRLRQLFVNTFANTLDTTAYCEEVDGRIETYIITGDIEAMWLRDSTAQIWHYLPLMENAPEIRNLIAGLLRRQAKYILRDPYANAFYSEEKWGIHSGDLTEMKLGVHERKWELDSLCYYLRLSVSYWDLTQDRDPFDQTWLDSIGIILRTMQEQQRKFEHGPYLFNRVTENPIDTLSNDGYGAPYAPTGLIASAFRPSDDACELPFNIPANFFARKVLQGIGRITYELRIGGFQETLKSLITDITEGLKSFSQVQNESFGTIMAYEVDGLGNSVLMDDANAPSLLSLPQFGAIAQNDPIYQSTRSFLLSTGNPYFYQGAAGKGVGSPHTGKNQVWPISLIFQALTSESDEEIRDCLLLLIESSANSGLLHESFDADNPNNYSRPWFAWCNSLFGGLIAELLRNHMDVLRSIE